MGDKKPIFTYAMHVFAAWGLHLVGALIIPQIHVRNAEHK